MDHHKKELLVSRIMAGYLRVWLDGSLYKIHNPTNDQVYEANEFYEKSYASSLRGGDFTEDQLLGFLVAQGVWDEEKERELQVAQENVEKIKVNMFELNFRSNDRNEARKLLKKTEARLEELQKIRHSYDYLSAEYSASLAKIKLLIGLNLEMPDKTRYWNSVFGYNNADPLLDKMLNLYYDNFINEKEYRELARTEPWRLTWTAHKTTHAPFPCISSELKMLIFWSKIYDNINESPECPDDSVIEDDDMLDGWMIIQRKNRDDAAQRNRLEKSISANEKIQNAHEVYLIGQTEDDRKKIHNLNDVQGKMIKQKRWGALKRAGKLHELEMPDTKQRLMTELNAKFIDGVKNGS